MPLDADERVALGRILLGSRLREVREAARLGLSDASSGAGISYSYLSDVERGRRLPTLEVLDSLASTLGTSVSRLLSGLYPWDLASPPPDVSPPPDARRRKRAKSD